MDGTYRSNRNTNRSNRGYGANPQGWEDHPNFRRGETYTNNYVPANRSGIFGNEIPRSDPNYRYRNNTYVDTVIEGFGVLGDVPAERRPELPQSNYMAAAESRSSRLPSPSRTRIEPSQRTGSRPTRPAREVGTRREAFEATAEGRMGVSNQGGATARRVSESESLRRPTQEPERDLLQRYGLGRSRQQADTSRRADTR